MEQCSLGNGIFYLAPARTSAADLRVLIFGDGVVRFGADFANDIDSNRLKSTQDGV